MISRSDMVSRTDMSSRDDGYRFRRPPIGPAQLPPLSRDPPARTEPPAKRTRFDFGGDTITVLVGPQEKHYYVHKKIVCQASDFFRAACAGDWRESREGRVKLPEVQPTSFDVYVCWVYTGDIEVVSETADTLLSSARYEKNMSAEVCRNIMTRLIHSFALGDMLQDATFKNAIIDEFAAFCAFPNKTLQPPMADLMWTTVPHDSTFAKAFVDQVAVRANVASFIEHAASFPTGFVVEVAKACMRDRELIVAQRGIANRSRCFYHDHEGGKGKTKCCSG